MKYSDCHTSVIERQNRNTCRINQILNIEYVPYYVFIVVCCFALVSSHYASMGARVIYLPIFVRITSLTHKIYVCPWNNYNKQQRMKLSRKRQEREAKNRICKWCTTVSLSQLYAISSLACAWPAVPFVMSSIATFLREEFYVPRLHSLSNVFQILLSPTTIKILLKNAWYHSAVIETGVFSSWLI